MFIQTEKTPNPETLKFIPGEEVMGEMPTMYFKDKGDLHRSPLAQQLFNLDNVVGVYLGSDFLTVTLKDAKWENSKTEILANIMNFFVSGEPIFIDDGFEDSNNSSEDNKDEISLKINDIIETKVRPAVAQDGGDIIFESYKDGIVYLNMRGSCDGCPSSEITLKNGIENLLKHYVPEVKGVVPI